MIDRGPERMKARAESANVFVVDFDGVLCNSAVETGVTAWRAGSHIWPEWQGPEPPSEYLSSFVSLRPVLEKGYQAIILMRLIATGVEAQRIELQFPELSGRMLESAGRSTEELARLFCKARDSWIASDLDDWLGRHSFYSEVIDTFAERVKTDPVFILTTKQERFVAILLKSRGINPPASHIFGLDAGKAKEDILEELLRRPQFRNARFRFVEDRLETLIRIAGRNSLSDVLLYLAAWGYNTIEDRDRAKSIRRITVLDSGNFLDV